MFASLGRRWYAQALLLSVFATGAHAQDRFNVEAFEPAPQVEGSVLNLYGGRTLAPGGFSVSLFGSYGHEPLAIEAPDGDAIGTLVDDVGSLQLLAAVGVFERVDLGVGVALHRTGAGSDFGDRRLDVASNPESKVAFGDVRIAPRVSLLRHEGSSGVDLALVVPMWLPTGNEESYAGEPFRIEPRLAFDVHSERAVFVINAGYRVRSTARVVNTELDDQVTVGVGADVHVAGGFGLLAMADSRFNVFATDFSDEDIDTELLFGARFAAGGFRAQLGAGPGVIQALTAPDYRVFAGLSYTHEPAPAAPPPPEPVLERDGDRDGVPDSRDRCPSEPEDVEGFQDDDGCPDADDDRDGIADARDRCPSEPEDRDGFEDDDGCPDTDDDGDGVSDAADSCRREPGVAAERGCPAKAVAEPPPVAAPPSATFELRQLIRFEKNRFVIGSENERTLDEIAQQLKDHPDARVAIEGHADERGSAELNDRLSLGRAESVRRALIRRGVAANRLRAEGFGSSRPVAGNDTEESRAQNRRVELRVESATAP